MLLVAGIDPLGAVAAEKVLVVGQPGALLEQGHTDFFRRPWINGRFEYHDIAFLQDFGNGAGSPLQRFEIGALGRIDRCRHSNNEDIAGPNVLIFCGKFEQVRLSQFLVTHFQSGIRTASQFVNSGFVQIKTNGRIYLAEFNGKRQPDITKSDNTDPYLSQFIHKHFLLRTVCRNR